MKPQQPRSCYYRIFVTEVRKPQAHFIGRHLGSEYPKDADGSPIGGHFIYFCSLYEDQDGNLYLFFVSGEFPGWPDYARIRCWAFLKAKTREELVDRFRGFGKANGVDNPIIPSLIAPLPPIEEMHEMTGWDS
jgi:hypothetical protein